MFIVFYWLEQVTDPKIEDRKLYECKQQEVGILGAIL
jgi:hypothetical protein